MSGQLKQMLHVQWKASRWPMLPFVLLSLGLPAFVVQMAQWEALRSGYGNGAISAVSLVRSLNGSAWLFPLLAVVVGTAAALTAWNLDHRMNHVYALSLPLSRARYAVLKMTAGAVPVLVAAAIMLVGAVLATATADVPPPLRTYPISFTLRFLFSSLLIYSILFSMAAGTLRTAIYVVVGIILFVVFGSLIAVTFQSTAHYMPTPFEIMERALTQWPGPFSVFGGSWMLIDV